MNYYRNAAIADNNTFTSAWVMTNPDALVRERLFHLLAKLGVRRLRLQVSLDGVNWIDMV